MPLQAKTLELFRAVTMFVETIERTGGVIDNSVNYVPKGDEDWPDLGEAYISMCKALGRTPKIEKEDDDGP